jgi:hypothetical protein
MHKSATKCNETLGKWCKNKHGASKIIDTFETYQPSELEVMLKDFIGKQTAFNKSVEEKLGKIDILACKIDSLALDVKLLKLKVLPNNVKENNTFSTANAIQVRIDENVRMLAELHASWEREDEMARM